MLPTITLTCPLDGLALAIKVTTAKGDLERNGALGGHLHLEATDLTCANGHSWTVSMELERVA